MAQLGPNRPRPDQHARRRHEGIHDRHTPAQHLLPALVHRPRLRPGGWKGTVSGCRDVERGYLRASEGTCAGLGSALCEEPHEWVVEA